RMLEPYNYIDEKIALKKIINMPDEVAQAIKEGDIKTLQHLITKDSIESPHKQLGMTPLVLAAYYNEGKIMAMLRERSARVDIPDNEGNTALHWFALHGNEEAVANLLVGMSLVQIIARNKDNKDAYQVASERQHDKYSGKRFQRIMKLIQGKI